MGSEAVRVWALAHERAPDCFDIGVVTVTVGMRPKDEELLKALSRPRTVCWTL
jgi:hypothetical protein